MLSHAYIGVSDLPRATAFYSGLMDELGFVLKHSDAGRGWLAWMQPGTPRPLLLVGRPFDGREASPGNGQMIALAAHSRAIVDRAYAYAVSHGGCDEGGPGERPAYHPAYYGAYFRDPEGNKLCVCCHDPQSESPVLALTPA